MLVSMVSCCFIRASQMQASGLRESLDHRVDGLLDLDHIHPRRDPGTCTKLNPPCPAGFDSSLGPGETPPQLALSAGS